jgi:hypothetical protein
VTHGFFGAAVGVVGFALLFTPSLSAQQLATLRVTVRDLSGRVIFQAKIALHNVDTGAKRTDLSSGTGVAVIPGLPAGSYQLTVESDQFISYQAPLTLTVGQIASVSVTLGEATVKQEVDVQDTVQGVDAQKSGRFHRASEMALRAARIRLLVPLISSLRLVRYRSQCS